MIISIPKILTLFYLVLLFSCTNDNKKKNPEIEIMGSKLVSEVTFPEWSNDATIYEVNIRQYTPEGTIAAFEKHLPRLKDLGVEILWIMPIQPISKLNRKGSLGSYYSISDYKAVNPEFGTIADFKAFVQQAHAMGFKVVLDWVANHTGWDNEWITAHQEWYTHDSLGHIIPPNPDWSDIADLNYNSKEMQAAMIDALKFWIKETDLDGYRCDVAGSVPANFWNDARAALDSLKPVWMLAEDEGQKELLLKAFNCNYGWSIHHLFNNIAQGKDSAKVIEEYFAATDTTYPEGSYMMQFTSNHDENSWNGTEYERMGVAAKTFAALTFVLPGMPLIYSGQEAGLKKRLLFFEKDQIDWSNLEMQAFYKKLIALKKDNKSLWNGNAGAEIHFMMMAQKNNLLAFSRIAEGNKIVALFNLSDKKLTNAVTCNTIDGNYTNLFTNETFKGVKNREITLDPWDYKILVSK